MEPVNILDARNRLSQLITAATNGEDVVIAKRGRPVVRIVPIVDDAANTGEALVQWLQPLLQNGKHRLRDRQRTCGARQSIRRARAP